MKASDFTILYVKDPAAGATFYQNLFALSPVEQSPAFAMFVLPGGLKLGLWLKADVAPAPGDDIGGAEIVFDCDTDAEVDTIHADWRARGLTILQEPAEMDFGYTFTAADIDGHRLRVYHVADVPV